MSMYHRHTLSETASVGTVKSSQGVPDVFWAMKSLKSEFANKEDASSALRPWASCAVKVKFSRDVMYLVGWSVANHTGTKDC